MYYISLDVGTSSLKVNVYNHKRELLEVQRSSYQKIYADEDRYELDLAEIRDSLFQQLYAILNRLPDQAKVSIVLTTAMHSLIILDQSFEPLTQVITWNDSRGKEAINSLDSSLKKSFYERTGTPIHSMNPLYKLIEAKQAYQDWDKLYFASLKDYLFYQLTGKWWIDVANASASGLYSLADQDFDQDILNYLHIRSDQVPEIKWSNDWASLSGWGQIQSVQVYLGTSDGVASNLSFLDLEDAAVISFGSSHAVRFIKSEAETNYSSQQFCYQIDSSRYLVGLPSNNAGNVLDWILSLHNASFEELAEIIQGSIQVKGIFLPYLNGERSPIWQDQARAHYFNYDRTSKRQQVIFDMVCGLIFNMNVNLSLLIKDKPIDKIGMVGKITSFPPLLQVMADIFNLPIYFHKEENAETMGAMALLDNEEIRSSYQIIRPKKPEIYQDAYAEFLEKLHCMNVK